MSRSRRDPTIPVALSNYSASLLNECERKFAHEYLFHTDEDRDYVKPDYFGFGCAFHDILEKTLHDPAKFTPHLLDAMVREQSLDPVYDKVKILACLRAYWALHQKSGMILHACEIWLENDLARMKIDAVFRDPNGDGSFWWIGEQKTPAKFDPLRPLMIWQDQQVNLYAAFHDDLAKKVGLDPKKFMGVRYREVRKPGEREGKTRETEAQFSARCSESEAREIVLSRVKLRWDDVYENFLRSVTRAREIQARVFAEGGGGIEAAHKNTRSCISPFGDRCKYFSQCYGTSYTAALEAATKQSAEVAKKAERAQNITAAKVDASPAQQASAVNPLDLF
jgi:hypothetical protein